MDKGKLYVIGTPIGNLGDITLRAIKTLEMVDVVLAEDTRQSLKLLNHLNIKKTLISYHRHNEEHKIMQVKELLDSGKNVGLVSDAGMPIISDPGEQLVKYLISNDYTIEIVPGVTAVITALVKSSFDTTRFSFEGFLSTNKKQRRKHLESLKEETRTTIFYEAPHKILQTLKDIHSILGEKNICLARELTKLHEEFIYDNVTNLISKIEENGIKGEIVLIIEGADLKQLEKQNEDEIKQRSSSELVKEFIDEGIDKKEAIKKVAKLKGITKNEVYQECLDI